MRKIGWKFLASLSLVAAVALTPSAASAVGFEDSLDDCAYPPVFDLVVMRPLSGITLIGGTVLYVPLFPFALATVTEDLDVVAESLILNPARFTFKRRLGECRGVTISY